MRSALYDYVVGAVAMQCAASLKLHIHWTTWPVIAAALLTIGPLMTLLLFASIVAHEYGHALTARLCDDDVSTTIVIIPIGAMTVIARNDGRDYDPRFIVICAGPATNFFIAYCTHVATGLIDPIAYDVTFAAMHALLVINVTLGAFNLLPIMPLDGGRMSFFLLNRVFSKRTSALIAGFIGIATSLLLMMKFIDANDAFIGAIFALACIANVIYFAKSYRDEIV